MHQIDSGVIISFLKAILRKFRECVEIPLRLAGAAAKKLTNRMRRLLGKERTASGHLRLMYGARACLVPDDNFPSTMPPMYSSNWRKSKRPLAARVPATIAICCCFCLSFSQTCFLTRWTSEHDSPRRSRCGSVKELIGVTNVFLRWYKLFRQTTLGKTTAEINILRSLSER